LTALGKKPAVRTGSRRDLRTAAAAVLLLALCGGIWLWGSAAAREQRERVLAAVPAFPARGQDRQPRRERQPAPQQKAAAATPVAPSPPALPKRADPITSFVLKPAPYVALVHVNALLNTPLFARIKDCQPDAWQQMTAAMAQLGIDVERDVDRLAMTVEGMAVSGFFAEKPIAQNIASHWAGMEESSHRGETLWLSPDFGVAQVGNLLLIGPRGSMTRLLDRALDPAPASADPEDLYGDVFVRTDLTGLYGPDSRGGADDPDAVRAVLGKLSGVTLRGNVWDVVALSLDGTPRAGENTADLVRMARGAISLFRQQLDPADVELATLASLAKVDSSGEGLRIDLALPVNDLFDKLRFPCAQQPAAGRN
jgi:hypothetical protein